MLTNILILGVSVFSIIFAIIFVINILKKSEGTDKMKELSSLIHDGAMTFLNKEYRILVVFIIIVTSFLYYLDYIGKLANGKILAIAFVSGGIFSALAGNLGVRIATKSNARTANAVKRSLNDGLRIAFSSGAVMGLIVVGLGLLGVSLLYMIFKDPTIIYGFGFGASSIALFARVAGGIYTKAADVGADLVGKVEEGIPEDDPRNPAVIADNVGDNVGDVAGMGADLFESYVDSIIATMVIGMAVTMPAKFENGFIILPMALAALGILASIIGTFFVKAKKRKPSSALNRGIFSTSIIMGVGAYFLIGLFSSNMEGLNIFFATLSGLVGGIIIGLSTEYFTSSNFRPTKAIAEAAKTGAGTNVITGMSMGMLSTIIPILTVCSVILFAYKFSGLYGIAIASVGMLSTLGITLAADCYGPVADNAAGIAEMANMGKNVRRRAESLDAVGNTTAAIGKGFAIGSAALTALALFASYIQVVSGLTGKTVIIDITNPYVIVGLFIGGLLPFIFSALTLRAVGKAAFKIIEEVRMQFRTVKGLMEGKAKPDYNKCISISTSAALRQMILPGLLAVITPIIVGLYLGIEALGGLLAGVTVTGFLLAVFMANAGGAWDNAKKYIEAGKFGGKGSEAHKAAVVGDTVGDPAKDCSGPSINILIKLIAIVSLVFLPLFL